MKTLSIERQTFVHFLARGGDSEDQKVPDRNPHQELFFPEHCLGFVYYDRDIVAVERDPKDGDGPTETTSVAYNISGSHYRVARKVAKDGSPTDRMVSAMMAQVFEEMGQPEPEMAEVFDPDGSRAIAMFPLEKTDVIVREPHPDIGKRQPRRSPFEGLSHASGCGPTIDVLLGSLLHAMGGGCCRERPTSEPKADPAATPAE